jgi:hypothetical protein
MNQWIIVAIFTFFVHTSVSAVATSEHSLHFPLPVYVVTIPRHASRLAKLHHTLAPFSDVFSWPPTLTTEWLEQEPYAAADSKNFTPEVLKQFQLFPDWVGMLSE